MDDTTGQEQAAQEPSEAPPAANLYKRNPIQVEARQFFAYNGAELARWCSGTFTYNASDYATSKSMLTIPGYNGHAEEGFWLVKTPDGLFIALSDTDFEMLYSPVYPSPTGE